jgi:hypothetical protein
MASTALTKWTGDRLGQLDELEQLHLQLTGDAPGRRWITNQLDRSYVVVLASQVQGYFRDLHSETAAFLGGLAPSNLGPLVEGSLTLNRTLDRGNPNAGNLGNDFARFGFDFWNALYEADTRSKRRRELLEQVMIWRNAIAHESRISPDNQTKLEGTRPTLTWGRRWRRALGALIASTDAVIRDEVAALTGQEPWT